MGKILFLGTAGDSLTMGRQQRASGGILFEINQMQFLLNPGPGTLVYAKEYGIHPREITAVLVTQNNTLNANDTNAVVDAMSNGGLDTRGVIICHPDVLNGTDKYHSSISPYAQQCVERVIPIKLDDKVAIADVEVRPTETTVGNYGFVFTTDRYSISYLGESTYDKQVSEQHKHADVLIFSLQRKISTVEDIIKFVQDCSPKLVLVTGFGVKYDDVKVLDTVREIQKETGIYAVAAKDGMIVNPSNYSKSERQQKL